MPLWLIYGSEYIMALALAVIALFILGIVTRQIRFAAIESPVQGSDGEYVTEYMVLVGKVDGQAVDVITARKGMENHV